MDHAIEEVARTTAEAEPARGDAGEALERVLHATWHELARFSALVTINTSRLSAQELHRRHLPVITQLAPLIERGQRDGRFASDVPVSWHLAVILAVVHTASTAWQSGRLGDGEVEPVMMKTVLAAIGALPR